MSDEPPLLDPQTRRSPRLQELFLEHAPRDFAALERAVAGGNAAEIKRSAHRLKGGAYTFGAVQVGDLARELERTAHEGAVPATRALDELGAVLKATLALVESSPR